MASITIDIQDEQLQKLKELAVSQGISPEELLQASLENWLSSPASESPGSEVNQTLEVSQAMDYVLEKNAELYRRLA